VKSRRVGPQLSFPSPPPAEAPPSPGILVLLAFRQVYARFAAPILIGAGIIAALGAVALYGRLAPGTEPLTERELAALVQRTLDEAPPEPSFASLAYQVIRPSVVLVQAFHDDGATAGAGPGETGPGPEGSPEPDAIGTGVVITDGGLILTSLHVIAGGRSLRVTFADGLESEAAVTVLQPENDLAVLQAQLIPDDLIPATLASSAFLQIGDQVAAVGHPFGLGYSLSAGVVSGLGRSFVSPETGRALSGLIQFDAAVNPGNSGGPLVNRDGEVVGIVTALLNPTREEFFVGIGLAVTIETAGGAVGAPVW